MRLIFLSIIGIVYAFASYGQVQYTAGPALENDRDVRMNRMVAGDENSFYCYRVRTKGRGTSYFVEKYDKKKLQPVFSKEIFISQEEGPAFVNNVLYVKENLYIFYWSYKRALGKMDLLFQTVSATGQVSAKPALITEINTDHYEFADFDIYQNPSKNKFLVKTSYKTDKNADYTTDFILLDPANSMKRVWTKSIKQQLVNKNSTEFTNAFTAFNKKELSLVGISIEDSDDLYYAYLQETNNSSEKEKDKHYQLFMATLKAADQSPKVVELTFDDEYGINDIEFLKTGPNEMVVAGYVKDKVERKGRDLVKIGLFSYKINLDANAVSAKAMHFFDDKMLQSLESNQKKSKYFKYKLDYIFPIGDAIYYVGEQYNEQWNIYRSSAGISGVSNCEYQYMDVIVAKVNANGRFEWFKNLPLRVEMKLGFTHVFKQYIAIPTEKSLYILCNDHPKNLERYEKDNYDPADLKAINDIHGSNFVSSELDLATGSIKRSLIFENKDYCFAPIQVTLPGFIPPSTCEIFVPSKGNEIIIYTEDRGRDQFGKLKFK